MIRRRCTGRPETTCPQGPRQATLYNTVNPACLRCHDDGWRDFGIVCLCFAGRLRLSAMGYAGDRPGMAFDPTGMPFALHHGFPCCSWFANGDRRCVESRCAP